MNAYRCSGRTEQDTESHSITVRQFFDMIGEVLFTYRSIDTIVSDDSEMLRITNLAIGEFRYNNKTPIDQRISLIINYKKLYSSYLLVLGSFTCDVYETKDR